jgi:hypothetical protein
VHAGFDHVVLQNAGPDPDGFLDFLDVCERELIDRVRSLTYRPNGFLMFTSAPAAVAAVVLDAHLGPGGIPHR